MNCRKLITAIALAVTTSPLFAGLQMTPLSLVQAEKLALDRDTLMRSFSTRGQAFEEQAIASQTWSDPRLKFGALAVPLDTFDLDQEAMTQVILGYQQILPRGDSLAHRSGLMRAKASSEKFAAEKRRRQVLMHVRKAWLNVLLQEKSIDIINANRRLFEQLLDISQAFYASGRQHQQEVVQAELEISLVDDQLEKVRSALLVARAGLAKWLGEEYAQVPLVVTSVDDLLNKVPELALIRDALDTHPELQQVHAHIAAGRQKVRLAQEKYSPQWAFDVSYGKRSGQNRDGSDRADFVSAIISVDLPIFTAQKQDRELSASKQQLQATRYQFEDIKRLMLQRLQQVHARLQKLDDRIVLYKNNVLPQARQNADVALSGYQSSVVSFFTLTRARVTELNIRLAYLRLKVEHATTLAELNYLVGENG
jgi:outer membrane protein TolC